MDHSRIRFLAPMEAHDELFYFKQERSVRKDDTFSVKAIRYEAPRDLSGRKIQVRFTTVCITSSIWATRFRSSWGLQRCRDGEGGLLDLLYSVVIFLDKTPDFDLPDQDVGNKVNFDIRWDSSRGEKQLLIVRGEDIKGRHKHRSQLLLIFLQQIGRGKAVCSVALLTRNASGKQQGNYN